MISYKEQSSDSLKLFIGSDLFNRNEHAIVQESSFSTNDYRVKFGILAESHFVSIKHTNFSLDELCICTDTDIAGREPFVLSDNKAKELRHNDRGYNYTFFALHLKNGEAQQKRKEIQTKRDNLSTYHLEHVFPILSPDQIKPMTGVYVSVNDQIIIESVHTYPDEDIEVFTSSIITPRNN